LASCDAVFAVKPPVISLPPPVGMPWAYCCQLIDGTVTSWLSSATAKCW
jgi:hypothetical protein